MLGPKVLVSTYGDCRLGEMISRSNCIRQMLVQTTRHQSPPSHNLEPLRGWQLFRCSFQQISKAAYETLPFTRANTSNRNISAELSLSGQQRPATPPMSGQGVLQAELAKAVSVIETESIPAEADLLKSLEICERLAKSISRQFDSPKSNGKPGKTPTSNLLNLEERGKSPSIRASKTSQRASWRDSVEDTAYLIVTDAKTFLTPKLLRVYVNTIATLGRPQTLPEIFDLYAAKPIPIAGSSPIVYRDPEPTSFRAAIPLDIARRGLDAAIDSRKLALCMNIVSTTVATSAFRRNKVLRRVSLPAFALCLTPWASYKMAIMYMEYSTRSDPDYAFYYPFLAFMTFFSMTSLTAYIAITTSAVKDRVNWQIGTALFQRWTREEERAFADEIAQAWGFQDYRKRGEEEGKDWENLRSWLVERHMELDRPELMEGME